MVLGALEPAKLAFKVFVEAIRKGLPAEFKVLGREALLARNDRGVGVIYARVLESEDGRFLAASADLYSVWFIKIARLEGDSIAETYLASVPAVLSQHPHLFSTFEVDVWSRRFSLLDRLRLAEKTPPMLAPYRVWGAEIMELPDTGDYAAVRGDTILAWYNEVTGKLDDASKYLMRMGLL